MWIAPRVLLHNLGRCTNRQSKGYLEFLNSPKTASLCVTIGGVLHNSAFHSPYGLETPLPLMVRFSRNANGSGNAPFCPKPARGPRASSPSCPTMCVLRTIQLPKSEAASRGLPRAILADRLAHFPVFFRGTAYCFSGACKCILSSTLVRYCIRTSLNEARSRRDHGHDADGSKTAPPL